ncbi:hypothetical protein [Streptomyces sp. NPDC005438]|uniref:hypothetical protein n=1 Tax=Streptomyces sp. NPDC005438 TaxID=3156880 RepID=UPI0033B3F6A8
MSSKRPASPPASPASAGQEPPPGPRPRRIAVAAALTGLEGVVVAGFGLYSLVLLFTQDADLTQGLTLAVTVLALAVLPLVAARGLWLRRRWSRGPSMIVQLMALPVGWQMAQNGGPWTLGGVVIALVGLAVLGCLVNPTATEALGIGPREG